jgi:hypothetical protein
VRGETGRAGADKTRRDTRLSTITRGCKFSDPGDLTAYAATLDHADIIIEHV